ncbi:MAG: F0F1 ATP synthase subunit delta [Burkholderiales bacterium]|nr:F0F1 ATP synthase subunit delta [Burkholderiales bacterium]
MAELSTIARPYAEAAFRVARSGDLNAWSALTAELAAVAGTAEMRALVLDPNLTPEAIYGVFAGVLKSPLGPEAQNFLRLVVENDRVAALPEVAAQFAALRNKLEGSAEAEIASAFPLTDAQVADLIGGLAKKFGGLTLKARVKVDPELIGGVRVTVGDEVFDTSVRAQLERMRTTLTAA